jgi:hypothetical protein
LGVTVAPYHPTDVEWMVIQFRRYQESRGYLLILLCLVLASASLRRNLPRSSRVLSALDRRSDENTSFKCALVDRLWCSLRPQ